MSRIDLPSGAASGPATRGGDESPCVRRCDAALARLSGRQDRLAAGGRQVTWSRARLARRLRLSPARVEHLDKLARLRLLQALARQHPQCLLEMGASLRQVGFLRSMRITPSGVRRLWRRWCGLASSQGGRP